MEKVFALRHYRIILKSLPKQNRNLNSHLYKIPTSKITNSDVLHSETFLKDFQTYVESCKEYNVLLERYNIAVPRDLKNQVRNVSRMVGFELPKAFTDK